MGAYQYADVEALLVVWLPTAVTGIRALTDLPADLLAALADEDADLRGIVQVEAFGGADTDPSAEIVNVDVDVYVPPDADGEPDRAAARDLAEDVRSAVLVVLPGTVHALPSGAATVQAARTISRPTVRPYDESPVRRFHASYRIKVATRG